MRGVIKAFEGAITLCVSKRLAVLFREQRASSMWCLCHPEHHTENVRRVQLLNFWNCLHFVLPADATWGALRNRDLDVERWEEERGGQRRRRGERWRGRDSGGEEKAENDFGHLQAFDGLRRRLQLICDAFQTTW